MVSFKASFKSISYRHGVFVKDPNDFVMHLHEQLGLDIHETIMKIGNDGGRGSLKIMLLIVKDDPNDPIFDPPNSKKRCRAKGVRANSVKMVHMLAVVHGVPENYHNLKTLCDAVQLTDLKTCLCCDHKLSNIITGIQGF